MNVSFTSDFFTNNRARLRELFTGTAPIIITANGLLQRGADSPFPFQQDANFWYLTGINDPDVLLVIDKQKEYLIVPDRDSKRELFDGVISSTSLTKTSGVETVLSHSEGWKLFSNRLRKVKHVATIAAPPAYIDSYGMFTNPARARLLQAIQKENPNVELLDVSEHLIRMRMVKQAPEIAAIKEAIRITSESITHAIEQKKRLSYAYEYELEAEIAKGFRAQGAKGHAFDPIIATGKNATTIHYVDNNGPLSSDELIIMDVGAEVHHYAADISRTIAVKQPSRRQQQVFDTVKDVQAYAYSVLKPGVLIRDYEHDIEQYMGEKLRELGLIKTIESEQVRTYYPHATSHHLGLNVHDVADYDRPLEENMVITVEPGIYIPEEALGVRIEDDVRVTNSGIEVLSASLPAVLI